MMTRILVFQKKGVNNVSRASILGQACTHNHIHQFVNYEYARITFMRCPRAQAIFYQAVDF